MMLKEFFVNMGAGGDFSSSSEFTLSKVAQNNSVLRCAKNYLDLLNATNKGNLQYDDEAVQKISLPSDLMAVEQGISVLCSVYAIASKEGKESICKDVDNQLKSLSGFYFEKLTNAYFSACHILFDASNLSTGELGQIVQSESSLKEAYLSWPSSEVETDLLAFFENVDSYAKQFNVENSVYPEKRSMKTRPSAYFGMLRQRCI